MSLDSQTKEKIYSRVCELVTRKHFDPGMNGANWEELSKDQEGSNPAKQQLTKSSKSRYRIC